MHQPSIYIFLLTFIVPTTNLGVGKFDVYLQVFGVFLGGGGKDLYTYNELGQSDHPL